MAEHLIPVTMELSTVTANPWIYSVLWPRHFPAADYPAEVPAASELSVVTENLWICYDFWLYLLLAVRLVEVLVTLVHLEDPNLVEVLLACLDHYNLAAVSEVCFSSMCFATVLGKILRMRSSRSFFCCCISTFTRRLVM